MTKPHAPYVWKKGEKVYHWEECSNGGKEGFRKYKKSSEWIGTPEPNALQLMQDAEGRPRLDECPYCRKFRE